MAEESQIWEKVSSLATLLGSFTALFIALFPPYFDRKRNRKISSRKIISNVNDILIFIYIKAKNYNNIHYDNEGDCYFSLVNDESEKIDDTIRIKVDEINILSKYFDSRKGELLDKFYCEFNALYKVESKPVAQWKEFYDTSIKLSENLEDKTKILSSYLKKNPFDGY
jgi:hypothetical protein